ncbi:MAG: hypothetical protein AMJ53_09990 [Gammaproteobacteria bacterium SG8_11]|nr:MAG: hypothetical protein AMJ53_09990 [Gammaproteobacteria bacterium SG8_11]
MLKICFLVVALGIGLLGCHGDRQPSAPLGERAALEKLANAYETLGEQLPVSPTGLTPQGKLKFVQHVFEQAGYDFSATLQALAQAPPETLGEYHKDMMELVLLPNQGLDEKASEDLYGSKLYASINKIKTLYAR